MKNFKEWLSDNLRYFLLLAAVAVGIMAIVLGMNMYQAYHGDTAEKTASAGDAMTEGTVLERQDDIVIQTELVKEQETQLAAQTNPQDTKQSETEKQQLTTKRAETTEQSETVKEPETA